MNIKFFYSWQGLWGTVLLLLVMSLLMYSRGLLAAPGSCTVLSSSSSVFNVGNIVITPGQGLVTADSSLLKVDYSCQNPESNSEAMRVVMSINGVAIVNELRTLGFRVYLHRPDIAWTQELTDTITNLDVRTTLNPGESFRSRMDIQLRITKNSDVNSGAIKVNIPSMAPFITFSINYSSPFFSINTSAFNVISIPACFGKLDIIPSTIYFGHIYAIQTQLNKQASFIIRATRNPACLPTDMDNYDFITLNGLFQTTNPLMDGGHSVKLLNASDRSIGLKLSLMDNENNSPVTFNTPEVFGNLVRPPDNLAMLTKSYTAHLNLSDDPLITGPFSADIVVTISYQ